MGANPKKAAALGLMIVVALYFWGPLVWNWLPAGAGNAKAKADMSELILTDDPVAPQPGAKARGGGGFRWEKVRDSIRRDPHMVSAAFDAAWLDPFAKPVSSAPEAQSTAAPPAATVVAADLTSDPASSGLVLGGIIVGQRTKVATINGEPCREGETILVTDAENKSQIREVRVTRIGRHRVEVECQGQRMVLEVAPAKLASGDDIGRLRPSGGRP
jgi:hypothetical protein